MVEVERSRTLADVLDYGNPVLREYAFWCALLVMKMLTMTLLTALQRIRTKTFANPEDLRVGRVKEVKFDDPHVERVRRAHRNDLEAIVPFLLVAFMYALTDPRPLCACILFRVVFSCRLLHTIVYAIYVVPQPARAIAYFVPFFITMYMAIETAIVFVI